MNDKINTLAADHGALIHAQMQPHLSAIRRALEPVAAKKEALLAAVAAGEEPVPFERFGEDDARVLAAARWFKHEYFRWIDPIKCPACGEATKYEGRGEPDDDDLAGGAKRVELHVCADKKCGTTRRFSRYNKMDALMRTREGRCGEFAQLFYIFLIALGLEARYLWNSEDHVWCEYWSKTREHWVHVDPCEAEVNKPLLYARGWGKVQCYCLAFGRYGAEDMTRVYVDDWDECLERRAAHEFAISEKDLGAALEAATQKARECLDDDTRARVAVMDAKHARWFNDEQTRWAEAEAVNLRGRQSGTKEWREGRGEMGEGEDGEGAAGEVEEGEADGSAADQKPVVAGGGSVSVDVQSKPHERGL